MHPLAEQWLCYLETVRRSPASTLRAYRYELRDLESFDLVTVRRHLASRWGKVSPATQQRRVYCLRSFFRWAVAWGHVSQQDSPMERIAVPKGETKLPQWLSVEQCERLMEAPPVKHHGLRDRAILELLWASGLRCAELAALNVEDLDLDGRSIFVHAGKGGDDRMGLMGEPAARAVADYLPHRKPKPGHEGALFLSQKGRRITTRQIQRLVGKWGQAIGVDNLSPHWLRHSAATHLLNGGADIMTICKFLGHASVVTTSRYTHVDMTHLRKAVAKHPRNAAATGR